VGQKTACSGIAGGGRRSIIPTGMHVPSMSGVLTEEDARQLHPVTPELTAFAEKVRKTNVFLAEVADMNGTASIRQGPKVAVVMGSKSDYEVMKECAKVLADFKVPHEVRVISAHRTPDRAHEFATGAEERGLQLIIAAAGKAAHLAGVLAALTTLPVLGVPMATSDLGGLDSLLSMVQMPGGHSGGHHGHRQGRRQKRRLVGGGRLGAVRRSFAKDELKAYRHRMRQEVEAADAEVLHKQSLPEPRRKENESG
jgi:5-(carboxyamino)imidazole ribonucleotide mutase